MCSPNWRTNANAIHSFSATSKPSDYTNEDLAVCVCACVCVYMYERKREREREMKQYRHGLNPSSLSHNMCSSFPSMQLMTLSPTAPISTCNSCPQQLQGCTTFLTIQWLTWLGPTGNGQQLTSMTVDFPFYTPGADSLLWNLLWGRKEEWYHDLIAATRKTGYTPTLITVEMGSRGLPNMLGFQRPSNYMFKSSVNCHWMYHSKDRIRSGVLGTTISCEHYL